MKKNINKALHNIPAPDEDKMRFLYDSKTPKVRKLRSSGVKKSKSSKVQNSKTLEVPKSRSSEVKKLQTPEVKDSSSSKVQKFGSSKVKNIESSEVQDSESLKVKKVEGLEVRDVKSSEAPKFGSSEVQDIKTQAKYESLKKLTVLFSNKDIDTLVKLEREIMQNRDLKTERITKNSILRCLVKILPLIRFNKNKIPDENILMDRILKALEKKLNS